MIAKSWTDNGIIIPSVLKQKDYFQEGVIGNFYFGKKRGTLARQLISDYQQIEPMPLQDAWQEQIKERRARTHNNGNEDWEDQGHDFYDVLMEAHEIMQQPDLLTWDVADLQDLIDMDRIDCADMIQINESREKRHTRDNRAPKKRQKPDLNSLLKPVVQPEEEGVISSDADDVSVVEVGDSDAEWDPVPEVEVIDSVSEFDSLFEDGHSQPDNDDTQEQNPQEMHSNAVSSSCMILGQQVDTRQARAWNRDKPKD